MCDPVPPEVEFGQGLQSSEVGDTGEVVASKVEHPEVSQVVQALYVAYLREGRGHTDT